ncbi:PREDICTED: gem-associated protein 8-like [Ceratosolen solmsi marchali]|uniref:Gem-associated protein 8-like n=1 Tax=Ceratosolen solmsi marchali TaxID=326594 RepID=A0AAJ7E035_9HYME|nr:PREDICTED: gem-associated protein 8-like [Ceratosolen solmsi marchali]
MNASTFWKNYKAADEWQKTHNVTWWKTRCFALEHENHVLRVNIKNLISDKSCKSNLTKIYSNRQHNIKNKKLENESVLDENIEFHLNEDMMYFLTQSIKHKIELKKKKEITEINRKNIEELKEGKFDWINRKNEDAKLLYGKASSTVLAMETALEATIERHIDKTKPQYWPNIPLRL